MEALIVVLFFIFVVPGTLILEALGIGKNTNSADAIPVLIGMSILGFLITVAIYVAMGIGLYHISCLGEDSSQIENFYCLSLNSLKEVSPV